MVSSVRSEAYSELLKSVDSNEPLKRAMRIFQFSQEQYIQILSQTKRVKIVSSTNSNSVENDDDKLAFNSRRDKSTQW